MPKVSWYKINKQQPFGSFSKNNHHTSIISDRFHSKMPIPYIYELLVLLTSCYTNYLFQYLKVCKIYIYPPPALRYLWTHSIAFLRNIFVTLNKIYLLTNTAQPLFCLYLEQCNISWFCIPLKDKQNQSICHSTLHLFRLLHCNFVHQSNTAPVTPKIINWSPI